MALRMGGVMIKVGQFLSARLDVLPPEITEELSGLQDEVPAEDFPAIRALAEAELGAVLEDKFERFETTPLAAAFPRPGPSRPPARRLARGGYLPRRRCQDPEAIH